MSTTPGEKKYRFRNSEGLDVKSSLFQIDFRNEFQFTSTVDEFTILGNKEVVCICYNSNLIPVYNISDGRCIGTLSGHVKWVYKISPFEKHFLLSGSSDTSVILHDCQSMSQIMAFEEHSERIFSVTQLDREHFASSCRGKKIKVWNVRSKKSLSSFPDSNSHYDHQFRLHTYPEKHSDLLFAISEGGERVFILDWKKGIELKRVKNDSYATKFCFLPSGHFLIGILQEDFEHPSVNGEKEVIFRYEVAEISNREPFFKVISGEPKSIATFDNDGDFKGIFSFSDHYVLFVLRGDRGTQPQLFVHDVRRNNESSLMELKIEKLTKNEGVHYDEKSNTKWETMKMSEVQMVKASQYEQLLMVNDESDFTVFKMKFNIFHEMSIRDVAERIEYIRSDRDDWFNFKIVTATSTNFAINKLFLHL